MTNIRVLEMIDRPFLGGGQAVCLSLAKNLDRTKFDISVCAQDGGPLADEVRKAGLSFIPVPFGKKFRRGLVKTIAEILRTNRIDILHTHGGIAGFYGRRAAKKAGTMVVVHTLHGIHYLHYRNVFLKYAHIALERWCSRFSDAVIFVSEADFEKGKKLRLAAEARMHLIKNGVDFSASLGSHDFRQRAEELRRRLKLFPPVVGTVARLHRQKGVVYLLRAAEQIHKRRPEAKIVVVGGGELEKQLRREARIKGIDGYFLLLGERKDARELLSLFDVFVLPSLWEGLPLVLIEAAAMGKPIIATDIEGVREAIIDGENGILVAPKNPEKIAAAVIRLLGNSADAGRLGERAKSDIPARFTLSRMIAETQALYFELAKKES
jgi:glycosyltransferase involved in cell wall biosynthesis